MSSRTKVLARLSVAVLGLAGCNALAPTPSASTGGVAETCPPVELTGPNGSAIDLSGAWSGNDGGVYYMKQVDSCLWWSGLSSFENQYPGEAWVMTFKGHVGADKVINGDFVDVKSDNPGSGTMTIQIDARDENGQVFVYLNRTAATGHAIGVTFWQRMSVEPTPPPSDQPADSTAPPAPTDSAAGEPSPTAVVNATESPTESPSAEPVATLPPG